MKKSTYLTVGMVFLFSLGVGLLLESPVEAKPFCLCPQLDATVSTTVESSSCSTTELEAALRDLAAAYCQANVPDSGWYCNFELDSLISCGAIDPGPGFLVGGSATFDCQVCIELP